MGSYDNAGGAPRFSERSVGTALGVEIFELLLGASELRVGRYDLLTHLFVFTADEVERLGARLGLRWDGIAQKLAENRAEQNEPGFKGVREPDAE